MISSPDEIYLQALSAMQAGDARGAELSFQRTLEIQPGHRGALNLYGILLAQRGRYDEAEHYLKRALTAGGKSEVSVFNYGLVLRALNKPLEALEQFSEALALNPSVAQTWNCRGALYFDLNRYHEAIADCDRAIAINAKFPDAFFNKGRALAELNFFEPALAAFDQALALQPTLARAWVGRGYALYGLERLDEASAAFDRALELGPGLPGTWEGRGKILLDKKCPEEALSAFDKALGLQDDFAEAWLGRGRALVELNRYEESLTAFQRALALKPDMALAYTNMAYVLAEMGKHDEAGSAARKAIEIDPNFSGNYFILPELKKFNADDPDLAAMEALSANTRLSKHDRMLLDFTLGKVYGHTKDYRNSFRHFLAGNAAKRSTIHYDEATQLKLFDRIEQAFSRDLIAAKTGFGNTSSRPIFVLGMPRSGSTLVEQILASHPEVESAGEVTALATAIRIFEQDPELAPTIEEPTVRAIAAQYLDRLALLVPHASRVIDKMPHNFFFIGLIHIFFPNAVIIHTLRDPADTCISCFGALFNNGNSYVYDLGELGRYYARYRRLMEHWRRVLPPDRILDVCYEDVVADLEGQARRILAHCGLPWDDRCLTFYQTQRTIRTASRSQVRQPIYSSAVGRWRVYAEFLTPLLVELGMAISVEN